MLICAQIPHKGGKFQQKKNYIQILVYLKYSCKVKKVSLANCSGLLAGFLSYAINLLNMEFYQQ